MTTENIIDIIGSHERLNTLTNLIKSVDGLEGYLASDRHKLTFLAPIDEAVNKFKNESLNTFQELLDKPDEKLKFFLFSHILEGSVDFEKFLERYRTLTYVMLRNAPTRSPLSPEIVANHGLINLNNGSISIHLQRRELFLSNGQASNTRIIQVDIPAKNGVIHLLDEIIYFG